MKNNDWKNKNNLLETLNTKFEGIADFFSEETLTFMKLLSINGGVSYKDCSFKNCDFKKCSFNTPCTFDIECDFKNCDWAVTTLPPTPTPEEPE